MQDSIERITLIALTKDKNEIKTKIQERNTTKYID